MAATATTRACLPRSNTASPTTTPCCSTTPGPSAPLSSPCSPLAPRASSPILTRSSLTTVPCSYDSTNIANVTGVFVSSYHGGRLMSGLLSGWKVAPLFRFQSGLPVNPLSGADNSLTGIGLDRPNVTGLARYKLNPTHTTKLYQYVDGRRLHDQPTRHLLAPPPHFSLRAPHYVDVDSSLEPRLQRLRAVEAGSPGRSFQPHESPQPQRPHRELQQQHLRPDHHRAGSTHSAGCSQIHLLTLENV